MDMGRILTAAEAPLSDGKSTNGGTRMSLHLFARVDGATFKYAEGERAWVLSARSEEVPWPEEVDFALLPDDPDSPPRWTGRAEGVIHFLDQQWQSIGFILELQAPGEESVHVPINFALSPDSIAILQAGSANWFEHVHRVCRGVPQAAPGTAGLRFRVLEEGLADGDRVRRTVLASVSETPAANLEEEWARRVARPALASFWPALTAELLLPGGSVAPLNPAAKGRSVEPLLRHVLGCGTCRGGFECSRARELLQGCDGKGYVFDRLRRSVLNPARPRPPAQGEVRQTVGEVLLFARMGTQAVAGAPPMPRWAPVGQAETPAEWGDNAPFALRIEGASNPAPVIGGNRPVVTYLSAETRRVALLLTFRSPSGDPYYVPVLLPLDRSGGIEFDGRPDVWRDFLQRQVSGKLVSVGAQGEMGFRVEEALEPGADAVRAALLDALAAEPPRDALHAACRLLVADSLKVYWTGLALEAVGIGRDDGTLRHETPTGDLRHLVQHLLSCESSLAGEPCPTCRALATALNPKPNTGLETLARILEARFSTDAVVDLVATLVSTGPVTNGEREEALATLRRTPVEVLANAVPVIGARFPVTIASRMGAPWSLLAWVSLTRPTDARAVPRGKSGKAMVLDAEVVEDGWNLEKADRVPALLVHALRNPASSAPHVVLAALALAELGTRQTQSVHPNAVRRVLQTLPRLNPPTLHRFMTGVANRLVRILVTAESNRSPAHHEDVLTSRAEELWECLAAMPPGTRETRTQWLTVYQQFPWMRSVMEPAVAALDPTSPVRPAFQTPILAPDHATLASLAGASAEDGSALDEARLRLVWHWIWIADAWTTSAVPAVPGPRGSRVDGTDEYLRQFLWGSWRIEGAEAEAMWRLLVPRVLEEPVEPRVENQAWMSAARYRERAREHDQEWARIARGRLLELLTEGRDLATDMRPISLLRLLSAVEGDTDEFARVWEMVERAYDAAGIQGERQRCVGFLASRPDLAALVSRGPVRTRLNAALVAGNPFLSIAALRALLGAVGLRAAADWICRPGLHRLLWADIGVFWLQRLAASEPAGWPDELLNLLEETALGHLAQLARNPEAQYRLEALRSVDRLDPERAARLAERLVERRDLDLVRMWLRDGQGRPDASASFLLARYFDAAMEVGGMALGRAVELARQLEAHGVAIGNDTWERLGGAIPASLARAVTAADAAWLLAALARLPPEQRGALDAFEDDARLVLTTPRAPLGAGRVIFEYLSALSELHDGNVVAAGTSAAPFEITTYVADLTTTIVQSEPNSIARRLFEWLWIPGERIDPRTRSSVVMALAGAENARSPEGLLEVLRATLTSVLERDTTLEDFPEIVAEVRDRLNAATGFIDTAALEITRGLGVALDDVVRNVEQDTVGLAAALMDLPERWEVPQPDGFSGLFRLSRLLRLRVAVSQADALLHDVARVRNAAELARLRGEIREELIRIAVPAPRRFDEPWVAVHGAVLDLLERSGWDDVEVHESWTDEEITTRRDDALRLGALFDLGDLVTAVGNLVSNARRHGSGQSRVVVGSTYVEVRSLGRAPLPSRWWDTLNVWVNAKDGVPEPEDPHLRTGLRSVRRSMRRNVALRFYGAPELVGNTPPSRDSATARVRATDPEEGSEVEFVFGVSWQSN
jgi:hypothetical protein